MKRVALRAQVVHPVEKADVFLIAVVDGAGDESVPPPGLLIPGQLFHFREDRLPVYPLFRDAGKTEGAARMRFHQLFQLFHDAVVFAFYPLSHRRDRLCRFQQCGKEP